MFASLRKLLAGDITPTKNTTEEVSPENTQEGMGDISYASTVSGKTTKSVLPPIPPEVFITHFKNELTDLYVQSGLSREEFDTVLMPLVTRFCEYVQLAPASEQHHHSYLGGLIEHSLIVGAAGFRRAKGVSFVGDKQGAERVRDRSRWPVACGIAALLHDIGKISYDLIITSPKGDFKWNPYSSSLLDFARKNDGYKVYWKKERIHNLHEISGLALTTQIVPKETLEWLGCANREIIPVMLQAIAGVGNGKYPHVFEIVKQSDMESVSASGSNPGPSTDKNFKPEPDPIFEQNESAPSNDNNEEEPEQPSSRSSLFTEKIKQLLPELLAEKKLLVNKKDRTKGVLWHYNGQCWVSWPAFFNAIHAVFTDLDFKAYPKEKNVFFDTLVADKVLTKNRIGDNAQDMSIKIGKGNPLTLSLALVVDKEISEHVARYISNDVVILPTSGIFDEMADSLEASESPNKEQLEQSDEPEQTGQPEKSEQSDEPEQTGQPEKSEKSDEPAASEQPEQATKLLKPSEYIAQLNTAEINWLREQDEAGEIALDIGSALCHERLQQLYGVEQGFIWLLWPDAAKVLGDEPVNMIAALKEADALLRQGACKSIRVKASGTAVLQKGKRETNVLALNRNYSNKIIAGFGLDDNGSLSKKKLKVVGPAPQSQKQTTAELPSQKTKKITHKKTELAKKQTKDSPPCNTSSQNQEAKDTAIGKQRKSSADSGRSVTEKTAPVKEILHTFDIYLSTKINLYSSQISIVEGRLSVKYAAVIFKDACRETSLKENWWARLLKEDGISNDTGKTVFDSRLLPKTFGRIS